MRTCRTLPLASLVIATALAAGCRRDEPPPQRPPGEPTAGQPAAPGERPPGEDRVARLDGFRTPEAVIVDDRTGMYLVSNIHGEPTAKDGNGFISRISPPPDARIVERAWIDGTRDGVTLHAPKGMALMGDTLYVSDIDAVRMFDRATGAPKGEVAIPEAVFLNDVAAGDGVIYVSDTGLDEQFQVGPRQAIYELRGDQARRLASGAELGGPNGLWVHDGALWVVTMGSGELYRLEDGQRRDVERLPQGQLDGLVVTADGRMFVSSWEGQTVYHGRPGAWQEGPRVQTPADIAVDPDRGLLLIPSFEGDVVEIHPLPRERETR